MEGDELQKSPQVGYPADSNDAKYVSGLSTILVATIQEAKDRISQIEYIFCSQLYPNFQSKSKILQKIYSETRKAAEDDFKEKENNLLLQLEKLQEELRQKTSEAKEGKEAQQNLEKLLSSKDLIILGKENLLKELEERNAMLLKKQKSLEFELREKSKEDDGEMELQNKLLQLVQSKVSSMAQKDKQLMEYEQNEKELLAKLENALKKVDDLQCQLEDKTAEVEKGKYLHGNLLKKIELKDTEVTRNEQLLMKYEKENRLLQNELQNKNKEAEEARNLKEQLLQQSDSYNLERSKNVGLLAKLKNLEENIGKLQKNLKEKSNESTEGIELHGKLLQQIEAKESELQSEKKKRNDAVTAYKKLKSQYNFLCKKLPEGKARGDADFARHNLSPITSHDPENKVPDAPGTACEMTRWKDDQNICEKGKEFRSIPRMNSILPSTSSTPVTKRCLTDEKSRLPTGSKRPSSYWRDTRSHQSRAGSDLHDDFLDTPLENIRGDMDKAKKDKFQDPPELVLKDANIEDSDDETQDMNVDPGPQKEQLVSPRPGASGFKYIEPVRKKADRENLKGVDCKQCRKFYDAVHPTEGKDSDGNKHNVRCEHHDGVSRHRYRYAPPLTPDGFWNIGFESEM